MLRQRLSNVALKRSNITLIHNLFRHKSEAAAGSINQKLDGSTIVDISNIKRYAQEINQRIELANSNILIKTKSGMKLAEDIASGVDSDKFVKMQRYEIFISKMEQLAKAEQNLDDFYNNKINQMRSSFVNSKTPVREILRLYAKASVKGFDSRLAFETLRILDQTLKARGNKPRPYDDYSLKEMDSSWRMQQLTDHLKTALRDDTYFNHHYLGLSSRQLGEIGHKDHQLIEKQFNKLEQLIKERKDGDQASRTLDFEHAVYGSHRGQMPRHYIFQGFTSNEEFHQHLDTLIEWQTETNDGLATLGVTSNEEIQDLERHMSLLVQAINQIKDVQEDLLLSFDSVRQQYFKLRDAQDKHAFLQDNKYIEYDLLQIEELLVTSGYLTPEEAAQINASQPRDIKMKRAAQVFYDYVSQYEPELLAKEYAGMIKAADSSKQARQKPKKIDLSEEQNKISLTSMSNILVGLNQQALSFRFDSTGQDFMNKFYEDHCNQHLITNPEVEDYQFSHHFESHNVRMKQDYLRAYYVFEEKVNKLVPSIEWMVRNQSGDLNGQLHALSGLSHCKLEAPELRQEIFQNVWNNMNSHSPSNEAIIEGLKGIAMQGSQSAKSKQVATALISQLDKQIFQPSTLTFSQKLDLLWSACALNLELSPSVQDLFIDLNLMNFQRSDNDLTFQQAEKVSDIMLYMTQVSPLRNEDWVQKCLNETLLMIAKDPKFHQTRFDENFSNYDPFYKRVLEGLGQGLTMASIHHQHTLESHLVNMSEFSFQFNENLIPFKPDLILGLNGHKVLLKVISSQNTMRDTQQADGIIQFRNSIMKELNAQHKNPVETVNIPITAVVKYDIPNLKLEVNPGYNFIEDINRQLKLSSNKDSYKVQVHQAIQKGFGPLAKFGSKFQQGMISFIDALKLQTDKQRIDNFQTQLYKIFQIKQQTEKHFEEALIQQGLDQLKFEMIKLAMYYESFPQYLQGFVDSHVPENKKSLKNLLQDASNSFSQFKLEEKIEEKENLSQRWRGTRQEVELPISRKETKNICPELINQRFMWVDDYFHYKDWQESMKDVYDNFNLIVIPREKNSYKYFMDRHNRQRMVPQGIFPPPSHKRELSMPVLPEEDQFQNKGDVLQQFERDKYKMLVRKEIDRSSKLQPINQSISFLTNLQNIKQGLKRDYDDNQILDLILNNLTFTDALINEQLGKTQRSSTPHSLKRNPTHFRNFIRSTYQSKDQEDPFTHFYLKESGKLERIKHVTDTEMKEYQEFIKQSKDYEEIEKTQKILKTLQDKMEDMLMQNRNENEDVFSLSHHIPSEVKIDYNLSSLVKTEQVHDIEPELNSSELTDTAYLSLAKRRAETKLIKSKLIYKLHNSIELTEPEQQYLQTWVDSIVNNKKATVFNLRDSMVSNDYSFLSIKNLSSEDMFTLNQIPGVDLKRETHGKFALNDLILELSHFIDEETINKVELSILSQNLKKEWNLPENFEVVETRNKEIGLLLNEMEELAWRSAGTLDEDDQDTLVEMLSAGRSKTEYFDKHFYAQDMQSLLDFIEKVNNFDDRQALIEEWIARKELEINSRVVLPPKHLQKTDDQFHSDFEKGYSSARKKLVSKMLETDEFGNKIENQQYESISTRQLSRLVEAVCVRLHLFGGNYPNFMAQAVKGVMQHPNLSRVDYDKLNTFCQMFELDWRGDQTVQNKERFLAYNPVYVDMNSNSNFVARSSLTESQIKAEMKKACAPFVNQIVQKMLNLSKKKDEKLQQQK